MSLLFFNYPYILTKNLKTDIEQIRQSINNYIALIPEFMTQRNGVSYYRGGLDSRYLTAYVMWALHLAKKNGYEVSEKLVAKNRKLPGKRTKIFPDNRMLYSIYLKLKKESR